MHIRVFFAVSKTRQGIKTHKKYRFVACQNFSLKNAFAKRKLIDLLVDDDNCC